MENEPFTVPAEPNFFIHPDAEFLIPQEDTIPFIVK